MKKLWLIMLTLILFFVVSNRVEGKTTWTRVTSVDQIESGKIYMLAAYSTSSSKNYINYFNPNMTYGLYAGTKTNVISTIPETIITDSTKQYLSIILKQEIDGWTIYNTTTHKYNGYSTGNSIAESDIYSSNYYWTININDSKFAQIGYKNIPGLILGYNTSSSSINLRVS